MGSEGNWTRDPRDTRLVMGPYSLELGLLT